MERTRKNGMRFGFALRGSHSHPNRMYWIETERIQLSEAAMTITAPLLQKRRNKKSSPYPRMSTVNSPYSRRHGDEHSLQRKGAHITDLNREGVLVLAFRMNGRNYPLNEHKDVYQHLGAVAQSIPSWCSCSTSFSCCFACSPPSSCRQGGDYWKRLRCFSVMR